MKIDKSIKDKLNKKIDDVINKINNQIYKKIDVGVCEETANLFDIQMENQMYDKLEIPLLNAIYENRQINRE